METWVEGIQAKLVPVFLQTWKPFKLLFNLFFNWNIVDFTMFQVYSKATQLCVCVCVCVCVYAIQLYI